MIVGAQIAALPGAACRVEGHHVVEKEHATAGNGWRAHVVFGGAEGLAKTLDDAAFCERDHLLGGERCALAAHGRRVQARLAHDLRRARVPDDAVGIRQLVVGKEAGLPLAHGEEQTVAAEAVVVEEEDAHRAVLGIAVQVNLVVQRLAHLRQFGAKGHLAAQQAVNALALVDKVGAEIGDQQQIGLAGLDEHAHRHAPVVQIPGVGADVGLRPDGALLPDGAGLGVDAQHAVGQQQRRHGHAHLAHVVVLLRKNRPQHLGNLARRHVLQLLAIQRWAGIARAVLADWQGRGASGERRRRAGLRARCGLYR